MRRLSLIALAFCPLPTNQHLGARPVIRTWNSAIHLHPEGPLAAAVPARVCFHNLSDLPRSLHANGAALSLPPHGSRVLLLPPGTTIYQGQAAERHLLAVVWGSSETQTVVLE